MFEDGKIGVRQYTVLTTLFTIGTSILIAPSGLAAEAKQDAWIASVIGIGMGLLIIPLYNALGIRFPRMTIAQYTEEILGRWVGKTVILLYITFFFILTALMISTLGYFIASQILPETPIQFIIILCLSVVIMAVRLGLEVWARAAEIFFPWIILLLLILLITLLPEVKLLKLQPMFEEGFKPILRTAFTFFGLQQPVILLMIFPYVKQTKRAGRGLFTGTLLGGLMLILITILCIGVLGADLTARSTYPSFSLAKKIGRSEAVLAGLWFISIFFKITICFYASALGLAQTFKLKDYRPFLLPLGMIMTVLSLLVYPNQTYAQIFIRTIWTPYALTYMVIFPVVLFIVARMRKKTGT
ncbi:MULTISPECIES: endospore germination permease [unclassified Paenibacillus]|uniref:GerAB/ArcD/ProY family transporter n=1 Tax=unclassified Paenibacillus TaxID=185978 RepID=UPI001AE59DC1|nr:MULTISPECIES: endospore germination permease [unclassified Paenibacillus]MBP1155544.1 spore germination protein KB [Paenibacillus sp. PvP091]MBP1169070.1 spore germination protein KB [Paenibacillus sp. PvR098]MBP2440098.1 spore germination protein KB [Paenibacillus sp. PvP052]